MSRFKVYAEFEAVLDLDIEGIDTSASEHDIQKHRAEVLAALESRLKTGFGAESYQGIEYFEFDILREKDRNTS